MIQFLRLHTWTGNWTNLQCLLRLPDRQRGLLYSHPLSPHFCSKPDSLCTGPAGWRNCCHKIQRNLFHWAVQPESHQHHWKTHSYRGDIFLMIQITSKQPAYAKFVQLLWWIIHWPLTNCYFFSLSSSMWLSKPCTTHCRCQNAMFPPTVSSKTANAGCTLGWRPPWMKQWATSLWLCSREDCGRIQS